MPEGSGAEGRGVPVMEPVEQSTTGRQGGGRGGGVEEGGQGRGMKKQGRGNGG